VNYFAAKVIAFTMFFIGFFEIAVGGILSNMRYKPSNLHGHVWSALQTNLYHSGIALVVMGFILATIIAIADNK
jgi:hypothetical protein